MHIYILRIRAEYLFYTKRTNHTYFYTYFVENNLFSAGLLKAHYSASGLGFTVCLFPLEVCFNLVRKQLVKF